MGYPSYVNKAAQEADDELYRARKKFPRQESSPHEGYAVILEELDELWECVRAYQPGGDTNAMRKEAIQVAAMALRFVEEERR